MLDNNLYVVAPNLGTYHLTQDAETPVDTFGGGSMVVDHKGQVISEHAYGAGSTYCAAVLDLEGLRGVRTRSPLMNWLKDLRTELCQVIYDRELYPKNLWLDRQPMTHDEYDEQVIQPQIEKLVEEDIYVPPYWARDDDGG